MKKTNPNTLLLENIGNLIDTTPGKVNVKKLNQISLENYEDSQEHEIVDESTKSIAQAVMNSGLLGDKEADRGMTVALENAAHAMSISSSPIDVLKEHGFEGVALENFDDEYIQASRKATTYYNVLAGVPDTITDAIYSIFKPISTGNKSSISIEFDRVYIMGKLHHTNGEVTPPNDKVVTDILDNGVSNITHRLLPVVGEAADELLVDPNLVPVREIKRQNEDLEVLPIKFGKEVDYLALNQSPGSISLGVTDRTDTLDRNPRLAAIYYKVGNDVIRWNTLADNSSLYNNMDNGSTNELKLHYKGTLILDNRSKRINDNSPELDSLSAVVDNNLTIEVQAIIDGDVNTQLVSGRVSATPLKVVKVLDAEGLELSLDDAAVAPIVTLIEEATPIGYTPFMLVTDSNLRYDPIIIDNEPMKHKYPVSVKPGFGYRHPVNRKLAPATLNRLVTLAKYAKAHSAIETLSDTARLIEEYNSNNNIAKINGLFGPGGEFVTARYIKIPVDLGEDLNSISHSMRERDLQSLLFLSAEELGLQLWRQSGMGKAVSVLFEGINVRPVFTVLCDERIYAKMQNYPRDTEGSDGLFTIRFKTMPSDALTGKAFGVFSFENDVDEDLGLLDFGVCAEGTSLVYQTNRSAGNSTKGILQLHPIWDLHVNTPVIGELEVDGWIDAIAHIPG